MQDAEIDKSLRLTFTFLGPARGDRGDPAGYLLKKVKAAGILFPPPQEKTKEHAKTQNIFTQPQHAQRGLRPAGEILAPIWALVGFVVRYILDHLFGPSFCMSFS